MKCDNVRQAMLLYAVTDQAWVGRQSLYEQVECALQGGATCIQLREKDLDDPAFLDEALSLKPLCRTYGVPLIINDNVTIALQSGADGIHVGQHDQAARTVRSQAGDAIILGVSVQTVEQAVQAEQDGADYLGVGAVFPTATKEDADAVSRETLQAICDAVSIPVVAIGGINADNLSKLAGTGVDGVALVSAIFSAEDIRETCKTLRTLSERMIEA